MIQTLTIVFQLNSYGNSFFFWFASFHTSKRSQFSLTLNFNLSSCMGIWRSWGVQIKKNVDRIYFVSYLNFIKCKIKTLRKKINGSFI